MKMHGAGAQASGNKSGDYKRGIIVKMLVASKGNETGYVMRSLQVGMGGTGRACLQAVAAGAFGSTGTRARQATACMRTALGRCTGVLAQLLEHVNMICASNCPWQCHVARRLCPIN